MIKKVIGVITILLAAVVLIPSIQLIVQLNENGWYALLVALFIGLIGVVVLRNGLKGVVSSVNEATPKGLK
jgi:hypothetical protein